MRHTHHISAPAMPAFIPVRRANIIDPLRRDLFALEHELEFAKAEAQEAIDTLRAGFLSRERLS